MGVPFQMHMQWGSVRKWIFQPLLIIVLSLLLLEFILQIGAIFVWHYYRKDDHVLQHGKKVILCVGDSFTYGIGSRTPEGSYPAQLQKILNQDSWRVINAGWPGQN